MTQDHLDQFVVKGFGTIVHMLKARELRSQAGLAENVRKDLARYSHMLVNMAHTLLERPVESPSYTASVVKLDEAFVDAFENLVVYFEERLRDHGEPMIYEEKLRTVLGRFEACLRDC